MTGQPSGEARNGGYATLRATQPQADSAPRRAAAGAAEASALGFGLVRYFTVTALAAFLLVGAALYYLERREGEFFSQVQQAQGQFFKDVQEGFAAQQDAVARAELLRAFESSHVTLTRVFANALWKGDFAPFVAKAQGIEVAHCRALREAQSAAGPARAPEVAACHAEIGRRIMASPEFAALEAKVRDTMRKTSVFKIKVFDLRGITIYSSEHRQIGEDAHANEGWRRAAAGTPASELTHRDKFSAFEGVVEHRDLISSYLPVHEPGSDTIVGVFEIYSDVTPFLEQIRRASEQTRQFNAYYQQRIAESARENQAKVAASANILLVSVGVLMGLLYVAMFLIVRNGQAIIDRQHAGREQDVAREQRWQREKMAALSTMAANVAHEIGTPLTMISALAEDIAARKARGEALECSPEVILEQTRRMAAMIRHLADFAAERDDAPQPVDVNQAVKDVCDFMGFDRRFRNTCITFNPAASLPAREVVPNLLTAVLMNLLQVCAEGDAVAHPAPPHVIVETQAQGEDVLIHIDCQTPACKPGNGATATPEGPRIEIARRMLREMGGTLLRTPGQTTCFEIVLPPAAGLSERGASLPPAAPARVAPRDASVAVTAANRG